jgi:adenosylhomocysteine nucleosidase
LAALILVLAPMRSELRPVVRALSARRDRSADTLVYRARRHGRDVVAAPLGVGPAAARRATSTLLDGLGSGVDHVVVSGIAGGLDPAATVGTVLVPEVVIDLETDRELRPAPLGPRQPSGTVATAAELILDPGRLRALLARGVTALDMETAGVGAVCEERGVPWTAFRAVSDRPDDGLVDGSVFSLLNEDGTTDVRAGIRFALSHPGRLPALVRLARDSARGCELAARAAVEALPGT